MIQDENIDGFQKLRMKFEMKFEIVDERCCTTDSVFL